MTRMSHPMALVFAFLSLLAIAQATTVPIFEDLVKIKPTDIFSVDLCITKDSPQTLSTNSQFNGLTVEMQILDHVAIETLLSELQKAVPATARVISEFDLNPFAPSSSYQVFRDKRGKPLFVVCLLSTAHDAISLPQWTITAGMICVDDNDPSENDRILQANDYRNSVRTHLFRREWGKEQRDLLGLASKVLHDGPGQIKFYSKKNEYLKEVQSDEGAPVFSLYARRSIQALSLALKNALVDNQVLQREIPCPPSYFWSHEYFDKSGKSTFMVSFLDDDGIAYIESTPLRDPGGPLGGMIDDGYLQGGGILLRAVDLQRQVSDLVNLVFPSHKENNEKEGLVLVAPATEGDDPAGSLADLLHRVGIECRIERGILNEIPAGIALMGNFSPDSFPISVCRIFAKQEYEAKILDTMAILEEYYLLRCGASQPSIVRSRK